MILDLDTGIDDALAIAYALAAPECDLALGLFQFDLANAVFAVNLRADRHDGKALRR